MPRDIPVSNGNLYIAFDKYYRIAEFFFPHVGHESHTSPNPFHFGVWVNGVFSWIDQSWQISMKYLDDTLATDVLLVNADLKIKIAINDIVDFHENVYLKKLVVENLSDEKKEIRLFFCQDFNILGSEIGDTALYRPEINALLHYKSNRWFLINCFANKKFGFDSYATGKKDIAGEFGTWMDAQDGILSENPIAQGSVDSAAEIRMIINPNENDSCFYWICAGLDWDEVRDLNGAVIKKKPQEFLKRTINYWRLWVDKEKLNFSLLPDEIASLYKKSLLICRTQINNNGSIIAANDSEIKGFNPDTYSYMWPRDGALTANALDLAGYFEITRKFYKFCARVIEREGYFMHKYTPIGSLGSSWLPWVKNNKTQLPIQEDETALVLWALWENFNIFHEIEFIKPLYKPLIKNAADFMMNYRDLNTGLPLPSYDLWEERRGVLTFTTAAVYGGLMAAANFTRAFGDVELARAYSEGAQRMRKAMDEYMYLKDEKRFCKMINFNKDGSIEIDKTIDASVFGTFAFGAYEPGDDKVKSTMQQVYDTLWCKTKVGGIARYKHDTYFAKGGSSVPGNPWFVTTLWLAYYYVVISKNEEDLSRAMDLLKWVQSRALPSGVLAEQVDPLTNEPLSVSPLTWSHSTFILVVQAYLNKLIEMHKCPSCGISKYLKNIV